MSTSIEHEAKKETKRERSGAGWRWPWWDSNLGPLAGHVDGSKTETETPADDGDT